MDVGRKRKSNKWLVVVLCALVVIIIGLVTGIIITKLSSDESTETISYGEEINNIVNRWQEDINSAQTDEERYNAYMSVAIDLDKAIEDKEDEERSSYCEFLLDYVEKASEFAQGEDDMVLIKAIKTDCVAEEEVLDFQIDISSGEGQ